MPRQFSMFATPQGLLARITPLYNHLTTDDSGLVMVQLVFGPSVTQTCGMRFTNVA